jgi:hypothetical protein
MSKWFCFEKEISPAVKILAFDAGYLLAKNNKGLVARAIPVAEGILKAIENGSTNEAMNNVFKQTVLTLVGELDDPMTQANVLAVLQMVKFDPRLPEAKLTNDQIRALVESFMAGVTAVK